MKKMFGKKDVKEELREQNRVLRSAHREIDRDRNQLEREKKRIELEIKKMAKEGNKQACVILAKQLVQLRNQETRNLAASSRLNGIKTHTQVITSNLKLGEAMKKTTDTMAKMNEIQNPVKTSQVMREFEKQNIKLGMTDEMINETLDGVLEGSDDEQQSDAIVNQILDEIGIEITGKMINAPTTATGILETRNKATKSTEEDDFASDADIQSMLNKLKA